MDCDLKAMDMEIVAVEQRANRLEEVGLGIEAVERKADAILTLVHHPERNASDIIE